MPIIGGCFDLIVSKGNSLLRIGSYFEHRFCGEAPSLSLISFAAILGGSILKLYDDFICFRGVGAVKIFCCIYQYILAQKQFTDKRVI
ncbi:hypothetical protein U716_15450 [Rhodobacter capsulatus B6]|nr:hypothetical protein U716_15450 [Rhodobacter capsulatus B6]